MGAEVALHQAVFPDTVDSNLSDSDVVYYVRNALISALQGDRDRYDQLVGALHKGVLLRSACLNALSGAVSCINVVHHGSLLDAVFNMNLWDYHTEVIHAAWLELIISLAASNGQLIDLCLSLLVGHFVPPLSFLEKLKEPHELARKNQVLDRVHSTLNAMAILVPLSPTRLAQITKDRMPHIYSAEPVLAMYVENMLRLESGAFGEHVRSTMFLALVDRLIDLDVDIAWEDILRDETKGIFDLELEDLEGLEVHANRDGDELPREDLRRFLGGNESAQKLDSLLKLTFEHLDSCKGNGRLIQVFEILLQSFQKTVLTAYKSKFAQFVIFYACSLDPENCGKRFADVLQHIFESSPYPEWRMSAVAYLASYLSRAMFVSASSVASILGSLVNWCSFYCQNLDDGINPKAHKIFYAACQAIMYVLCFRVRSIRLVPRLESQLHLNVLEDILRHPLNPLKVCLPTIVEEFKETGLFSMPDSLEYSGRLESKESKAFGGVERLHMFFPFDPCLLKKSDRFIRPNFIYWSMVRRSYDEDDADKQSSSDEEDMDEACDEDDVADNAVDIPGRRASTFKLDNELEQMSISPKNSLRRGFGGRVQMPSRIRPSTSPESL